jgi:N utilization substance protein B
MQSVYAFNKAQESNYYLGIKDIDAQIKDALLMHGREHKERLDEQQKKAVDLYREHHQKGKRGDVLKDEDGAIAEQIAWDTIYSYQRKERDEFHSIQRKMISETEHLFNKYLRLIRLAGALADYIKGVQEKKQQKTGEKPEVDFSRFYDNDLLVRLRNSEEVQEEKFFWELEQVIDWSKMLRSDEKFLNLLKTLSTGLEADKELMVFIFREFMFKNELLLSFLEESDLNWIENRPVLRNMLLKTVKGVDDEEEDIELFTLSRNWEDDREFFEILFKKTISEDEEWEKRIASKAKRWANDRIATVDKILIKMALSEMTNFPSIPVKVTINEFMEISKIYSTPKSWQFMNGILDAIAKDMQEEGIVRKSGRGLIDNK